MRACKATGCKEKHAGKGFIVWCSPECGLKIAQERQAKRRQDETRVKLAKEKAERKIDKAKRESLKTRSDYMKDAQREFNKYIRTRDAGKLCICCDLPLGLFSIGGAYDCGHYRSVGSAPNLRFDERNAHAQRKQCNRYGAGRAVDYRRGLLARIGAPAVEALESDQTPRHYSIEDLKQIIQTYRAKARALEKQNG